MYLAQFTLIPVLVTIKDTYRYERKVIMETFNCESFGSQSHGVKKFVKKGCQQDHNDFNSIDEAKLNL